MSQAEIDRIWSQWRKTGQDVVFHKQFQPKPDRLVSEMSNYNSVYFSSMGESVKHEIPRSIHQTYKTSDRTRIEGSRLAYMDTWVTMNRGYNYTLWTDDEMWKFVKENYPDRIQRAYKKLPMIVQKTDFFRYLVINKLGGYYTDTDTRCARNLDWWRLNHETESVRFIVGLEWYMSPPDFPNVPISITQWAFASSPNHPILQKMIETVTTQILEGNKLNLRDTTKVVEITGPFQWTRVIRSFIEIRGGNLERVERGESVYYGDEFDGVLVLPPVAFNPGSFEPNTTRRDERTVLYHEFAGNKGWKRVKSSWSDWLFGGKEEEIDVK
ncbi:UNVERIFIED_CONTAM: membrane-bound alpha-1,6- mannosyltransferase Initiation-specific [Siphonaria sp. JEL0065]|nr:membrane-bound alpha-1,6- mannosyltransferase Initiation-specific [Siphonaria sp. JEL0065]